MAETSKIERRRVEPTVVAMIASGRSVAEIIRGVSGADWFGPLQPLPPLAPPGTQPRRLDYPVGANLDFTPRADEAIGFRELRALADGWDLLRLVIETRKDQVSKVPWTVRLVGEQAVDSADDDRVRRVTDLLRYPDGEHPWQAWLRSLLEDMFVIDAASILPRRGPDGDIVALDVIDGATIKRLIDAQGRTPAPPSPAYQQIIKGLPAIDLAASDLVYMPRNLRAHKVYGYSPVEQVVMTINIALRRQISQLSFYTEGNVPEALVQVPETWTADQIRQFQGWFDSVLSGNLQARRRLTFIPEAGKVEFPKLQAITDPYDEWLARIVCFAFSIPPTPFTRQTSRATAKQAQQQALEEGLQPTLKWLAGVLNLIIQRTMKLPEIEFAWQDDRESDALKQAQIEALLVKNGIVSIDEVRAQRGYDPIGQSNAVVTATGIVPVGSAAQEDEALSAEGDEGSSEPTIKLKKKGRAAGVISRFLAQQKRRAVRLLAEHYVMATKADGDGKRRREVEEMLALLVEGRWEELADNLRPLLSRRFALSAAGAAEDLGAPAAPAAFASDGAAYAAARTANMTGAGADWSIVDTTRDGLRSLLRAAIDGEWPPARLIAALDDAYVFSSARAQLIADTETAMADAAGTLAGWAAGGVHSVRWETSPFHILPDECDLNVARGAIPLGEVFPSGVKFPPSHPHCGCRLVPVKEGPYAVQ